MLLETTSALTVGLTRGITPNVDVGKLVITLTMYAGRVDLTIFAFAQRQSNPYIGILKLL